LNAELDIDISIASRGSTTSSQVVARIGLPGGVEIRREEMNRLVASSSIDLWTVEDGCLDLYWSRPIQDTLHLKVPARARVAGFFRAQPAVVFPYYESGKESYAEPLALKIHNTFGIETPFDPGLRR
jgi:hypothetical protein